MIKKISKQPVITHIITDVFYLFFCYFGNRNNVYKSKQNFELLMKYLSISKLYLAAKC